MTPIAALMLSLASAAPSTADPQGEVLNFTATWCAPCRSMSPVVETLKRQGYPIRKIDIDAHPELAAKYRVESVPQFLLVIDGEVRERLQGVQDQSRLKQMLAQVPRTQEPSKSGTVEVAEEAPHRRWGLPVSFRGKTKREPIETPPETVRAQNSTESEAIGPVAKDPMESSVRLKVSNRGSLAHGSGTIVHSTTSQTLIVTCAHLFRGNTPETKVSVDLFADGRETTHTARLLRADEKADVALIAIVPDRVLPCSKIAPRAQNLRSNEIVFSVGCGNGDPPTKWQMFAKNTFDSNGSRITECSQAPVLGRSGGGLFNRHGELIGVCMAADKRNSTGLYAAVEEIHKLLDQLSLSSLYRLPASEQPAFVDKQADSSANPFETEARAETPPGGSTAAPPAASSPVALSDDEVEAIAAALQHVGPNGVTVSVSPVENADVCRVMIVTRGVDQVAGTGTTRGKPGLAPQTLSQIDLDWDNHLESTTSTHKLPASNPDPPRRETAGIANDFPEWALDRAPRRDDPQAFQRTIR